MARRGEGQFVAVEVNLRNDPKVLGLARRLKIHKLHAVGMVASWREFVLVRGTGAGVVRGYSRQELAEYLDWQKGPALLIDALKAAGMVRTKRGAFLHPFWGETTTGDYAHKKSSERGRKAEERALRKRWEAARPGEPWPGLEEARDALRGHSLEGPGTVRGPSADAPETNGHKVTNGPPGPPDAGGAGGGGDPRTGIAEWFFEMHPRLKNERICRSLLNKLTVPQAEQLRYALPRQRPRYIAALERRSGKGVPFADKYLREGYYLEVRRPAAKAAKPNGHATPDPAEQKRALVEREAALWKKRDEIRERLKADGISKHELDQLVDQELEKELEQGGSPS